MTNAPGGAPFAQAAEAAVVALAMGGDQRAFSELVRRRQSWLRNLLRRLCRDPALADDLAQQVFVRAWRSLPTLRSVAAFGGWLRRLAVNTWLTHLRTAPPPMVPLDSVEFSVPTHPGTAPEQLDLDRALELLSRDERLCVVLAYNEGMSHGEITAVTGLPLGSVKSHVRRGAERLRTLLDAYQPDKDHAHAG